MSLISARTERCRRVALSVGVGASLLLAAAIYFGSGDLSRFDPALAAYAMATVVAAFGIAYRYAMWLQRPTTWRYFKASWKLFLKPTRVVRNALRLVVLFWEDIVIQKFIEKRSLKRWLAHMGIAWGCILAFFITLPLSWGWIQFLPADNRTDYAVVVMGIGLLTFDPNGFVGWLFFNWLNVSAILVLIGVGLAMHRRLFDRDARALQSLAGDVLPLFLLFAVSVTGLMLTVSERLMGGTHFSFLSLLHAFVVVLLLLFLPFGKLFHILQRPAQIGVAFYKEEGLRGPQALCSRSGVAYQSQLHHDDLVSTMKEIDLDFGAHQNLAPPEKIRLFALNQLALLDEDGFVGSTP